MEQLKSLTALESGAVERFLKNLRRELHHNFLKAILFGSRARGKGNEDSDIDILVILREISLEEKHKVWDLANDIFLDTEVYISPLVMSEAYFKRLQGLERLLPKEIEKEGIPL